ADNAPVGGPSAPVTAARRVGVRPARPGVGIWLPGPETRKSTRNVSPPRSRRSYHWHTWRKLALRRRPGRRGCVAFPAATAAACRCVRLRASGVIPPRSFADSAPCTALPAPPDALTGLPALFACPEQPSRRHA